MADALALWKHSFGSGSLKELGERLAQAKALAEAEADGGACTVLLRASVEREHLAHYGQRALAREADDEHERDAAVAGDAALVRYEAKWASRLARLVRVHPERWQVPGLSDTELCDELTLRLIDALRSQPSEISRHLRAGKEWGLVFLAAERRRLSTSFRLKIVLEDSLPHRDRSPTEEERLLELEAETVLAVARERAEQSLSRPQRRWLAALKLSANAGAFFESSASPNLSAAARLLDKHRSSAQRAFGELKEHFGRELRKLGG